jgi:chromosome segregation ATPase
MFCSFVCLLKTFSYCSLTLLILMCGLFHFAIVVWQPIHREHTEFVHALRDQLKQHTQDGASLETRIQSLEHNIATMSHKLQAEIKLGAPKARLAFVKRRLQENQAKLAALQSEHHDLQHSKKSVKQLLNTLVHKATRHAFKPKDIKLGAPHQMPVVDDQDAKMTENVLKLAIRRLEAEDAGLTSKLDRSIDASIDKMTTLSASEQAAVDATNQFAAEHVKNQRRLHSDDELAMLDLEIERRGDLIVSEHNRYMKH